MNKIKIAAASADDTSLVMKQALAMLRSIVSSLEMSDYNKKVLYSLGLLMLATIEQFKIWREFGKMPLCTILKDFHHVASLLAANDKGLRE